MTNQQILDQFETFAGESLDETTTLALANQAKTEIEIELKLECNKKLNTSQSSVVGSTYLTDYNLPTGMLVPAGKVIYIGTEPRFACPFEQRLLYKDDSSRFYVDLFNSKFHLCGNVNAAETITFPYIAGSDDIAANNTTVLKWPSGTHILIPIRMVKIWFAIDQGDKSRSWMPEWSVIERVCINSLINWDHEWKLLAINGQVPYGDTDRNSPDQINDLP